MSKKNDIEGVQSVIALIGVYEGVLPFVSKIFGWEPFLAFPVRLDAPWWWLVSAVVVVVTAVALVVLDKQKVSLVKPTERP